VVAENNVEAIEQLDLPATEEPVAPTIQEPLHEDVITNVPVNVESPQDLSTFKIPEPVAEEEPAIMEPIGPVAVDIQMPEMPETIVANEPSIMDENIFESVSTQQMTEPTQMMPETPQMDVQPQTEQFEIPSLTQSEEILNSIPTAEETSEEAPMFEPVDTVVPAQEEISIEMPTMAENPELQVTEVNVMEPANQEKFQAALQKCGFESGGVPVLVIGDKCEQGYAEFMQDTLRQHVEVDMTDEQKAVAAENKKAMAADAEKFKSEHADRASAITEYTAVTEQVAAEPEKKK
jgi:hypothetical protein